MKTTMSTIALTQQSQKELDRFIEFINELIDNLKESKRAVYDFAHNCNYCYNLRQERKMFAGHMKQTLTLFSTLSEKQQVSLELHYFRGLKELNNMLPEAEKEIREDFLRVFSWFMLREIKKTINIIADVQNKMSSQLYNDNTQEILSNPELYKELVNNWADLEAN